MAKKIIGIILTVLGGLFLLMALLFGLIFGGIGTAMNTDVSSDDSFVLEPTTRSCSGKVLQAEEGTTVVQYEVDGESYSVALNLYSSSYPAGTEVTVYYNETKPEECSVPEIYDSIFGIIGTIFSGFGIGFLIVFGILGVVFLVVGIILIMSSKKKAVVE